MRIVALFARVSPFGTLIDEDVGFAMFTGPTNR